MTFRFLSNVLIEVSLSSGKTQNVDEPGHAEWTGVSLFDLMVAKKRGGDKLQRPIRAFNKAWKAACVAAGCPGRILHDLRRTAVWNMVRRGVPERVAMQPYEHTTSQELRVYFEQSEGNVLFTQVEGTRGL